MKVNLSQTGRKAILKAAVAGALMVGANAVAPPAQAAECDDWIGCGLACATTYGFAWHCAGCDGTYYYCYYS